MLTFGTAEAEDVKGAQKLVRHAVNVHLHRLSMGRPSEGGGYPWMSVVVRDADAVLADEDCRERVARLSREGRHSRIEVTYK